MTQLNSGWSVDELVDIALWQKRIIWLILLSLVASVIPFATLASGVIQVYFTYKLANALRSPIAWLYILLGFIPLLNLFALLHLNGQATRALQDSGVRVGLIGADLGDIERLKDRQ